MRTVLAITLAALVAASPAAARSSTLERTCGTAPPSGPHVPAAMIFTSSCGIFRLDSSGRVTRLPRHWLAVHGGGTGRRFGADLRLRRNRAGRFFLLRGHRLVWRSSGLYPNDGGSVAFGPGRFAFATYRGGVYLTDLRSPERLVVRGKGTYPLDFTAAGRLIVLDHRTIDVVSPRGRIVGMLRFDPDRGASLDQRSDRLYFVTPRSVLVTLVGTRARRVASVARLEGGFSLVDRDLLTWGSGHSLTVTTRGARVVASARWPADLGSSDLGVSASADATLFAFRVSDAFPGKRDASSRVFVLRRGEHRAREAYRHRYAQAGCGVPGSLTWHRHDLLYDSGLGEPVIFDADRGLGFGGLARFVRAIPHRGAGDLPSAAWATDYDA